MQERRPDQPQPAVSDLFLSVVDDRKTAESYPRVVLPDSDMRAERKRKGESAWKSSASPSLGVPALPPPLSIGLRPEPHELILIGDSLFSLQGLARKRRCLSDRVDRTQWE